MKSPAWLSGYVESLDFPALTRYRSDCPVCGKKNTFSVTDDGMQRLWYCFHADCNVSGRTGITLTKEHAGRAFRGPQSPPPAPRTGNTYEIPETFVSISRSLDAELYVKRVQAYDAYLSGRADIRYDFKRNRAVFLVKNGSKVVDAVGRSIDGRTPKWYRYASSKHPFICGSGAYGVLVEDCASACAASESTVGIALMGTNLLAEHIEVLKQYERVFVALDKDATDKAITMVRALHTHVSTKLMVLRTDLKNMQKDERNDFLRSYIDR